MSCGCYEIRLQGEQYCQGCMPDEYSWLVSVDSKPDPFLMDRNHAYITPNNTVYVLDHTRSKAIPLGGNGGTGDINLKNYALRSDLEEKVKDLLAEISGVRTKIKDYKAGTNIEITPDNVINNTYTYDDGVIQERLSALESRTDENTKYSLNLESIPSETVNLRDLEFTTNNETGFGGATFKTTGLPSMLVYKGAYTTSIKGLEFNTTITKPDGRNKKYTSKFHLEFTNNVESNYISRDFKFLGLHAICNLNLVGNPSDLNFGFFVDVYNYDMDTDQITSDPAITVPITKEVFLGQETASAVFPDGSEVIISFTGEPTITTYRLVYRLKEVTE